MIWMMFTSCIMQVNIKQLVNIIQIIHSKRSNNQPFGFQRWNTHDKLASSQYFMVIQTNLFCKRTVGADLSRPPPIMHFQNLIWIMVYSSERGSSPFEKRRDHATTTRHLA